MNCIERSCTLQMDAVLRRLTADQVSTGLQRSGYTFFLRGLEMMVGGNVLNGSTVRDSIPVKLPSLTEMILRQILVRTGGLR
jgi:hypothetical protein